MLHDRGQLPSVDTAQAFGGGATEQAALGQARQQARGEGAARAPGVAHVDLPRGYPDLPRAPAEGEGTRRSERHDDESRPQPEPTAGDVLAGDVREQPVEIVRAHLDDV